MVAKFEQKQRQNASSLESRFVAYMKGRGFRVFDLDRGKRGHYKSPDYFCISGDGDILFFCECKYINSFDFTAEGFRISTLDESFTQSYLLTTGKVIQTNFEKLQSKILNLAEVTRSKVNDFIKNDAIYTELYKNRKYSVYLCLDADLAFSSFIRPTVRCLNRGLAGCVDGVLLYINAHYAPLLLSLAEQHF